jgi:DNA-binding response OmpR family regulator
MGLTLLRQSALSRSHPPVISPPKVGLLEKGLVRGRSGAATMGQQRLEIAKRDATAFIVERAPCASPHHFIVIHANGLEPTALVALLRRGTEYRLEVAVESSAYTAEIPDLAILLVRTPQEGVAWLRKMQTRIAAPVVVVCGDASPLAAANCLRAGAEDYIATPFNEVECLARIARRCAQQRHTSPVIVSKGSFAETDRRPETAAIELREHDWTVVCEGRATRLTPVQFRIVAHLKERATQWVRSAELQRDALEVHAATGASNVRFHVLRLRTALGASGAHLHSWQRRGYMWSEASCEAPHCSKERSQSFSRGSS